MARKKRRRRRRHSPGVFVEEVSSGSRPIEGVGTSTAAFLGSLPRRHPVLTGVAVGGLLLAAAVLAAATTRRTASSFG